MNTTSVRQIGSRIFTLWGALLLCLSGPACFRNPDTSKIPCVETSNCPNGYHCAKDQGTDQGTCAPGSEPADGSSADLTPSPGLDGKGGSLGDGSLRPEANDASLGGAGGAGGTTADGASGGSGGSVTSDVSNATGGTTSTPDAPSATGGTTSTPDAPRLSDASDTPATLPNGSPCTIDGQCSNGLCVDGHCCDSKCDGNCESCTTGICTFTSTPRRACGGSGKCAGICDKSNTKACTFDNTTICAAQSCSGGVRTNKSICDGLGNCPTQTTTICDGNLCKADGSDCATCTDEPAATTCAGGHCGPTTNNCGRTVQCSTTCSGTAQTCGGGGIPGMCGCTPASTSQTCGTHCGTLTNNCGLSVDCGGCTSPNTCGGGGTASVCGCTPNCTGKCGGADSCGGTCPNNCVSPQTCGGGGTTNVCGCTPSCSGKCGGSDSCGGTCPNNCVAPQTCGGGGTPNVCGCTRTTTCTGKCGNIVDNCGATLNCGTSACLPGQTCSTSNTCTCAGRLCTSICCPTAPAGTTSVCLASGTQCGTTCNPGTHSCGATAPPCYNDTDVANCGVEGGPCIDCRQPNTNQACGTGAKCANTCLLSQYHLTACAETLGKPNCSQWQFESGSAENWASYGDSSTGQPAASTAQHYSGSWSLSQALKTPTGQDYGSAYFKVLLCVGKEASSVAGKAISGQIRLEPPPSGNTTMSVMFFTDSTLTSSRIPEQSPRLDATSGWVGFNIGFPDATGMAAGIGIAINFNVGSYNGTVYLDDVTLQ